MLRVRGRKMRRKLIKKGLLRAARVGFSQVLRRLGVGGFAANVASYFVFKHIVRPIMNHYMHKKILKGYHYNHPKHGKVFVHLNDGGRAQDHYSNSRVGR